MKKFLKENWQYLVVGGATVGAAAGISLALFSAFMTWIMNGLIWILGELVTRL